MKTNIELAKPYQWNGGKVEGWTFNTREELDTYTAAAIEQATTELRHENANNKAAAELLKHALDKSEAMVAMLKSVVKENHKWHKLSDYLRGYDDSELSNKNYAALYNSAKSAEAYEKRIKAQALEEAAKEFDRRAEQAGLAKLILAGVAEELRSMAAELKGE